MIKKLNHVAIATNSLEDATKVYKGLLGASVSAPLALPEHGVTTVFVELDNTKIELLEPLGEESPIAQFLQRNPSGGVHHICYEVDDIIAARDHLLDNGARVLGSGDPKIGAHGKPVLFLHPKDFCGTLGRIGRSVNQPRKRNVQQNSSTNAAHLSKHIVSSWKRVCGCLSLGGPQEW